MKLGTEHQLSDAAIMAAAGAIYTAPLEEEGSYAALLARLRLGITAALEHDHAIVIRVASNGEGD